MTQKQDLHEHAGGGGRGPRRYGEELAVETVVRAREIAMAASEAVVDGQSAYLLTVETLLGGLLAPDLVVWNGIDAVTGAVMIAGSASAEWGWLLPALADTVDVNPLVRNFLSFRGLAPPIRMSDLVDQRTLRSGRLYAELWRPMGAEFQVGVPTFAPGSGVSRGWAVNRSSKDFTVEQLTVLAALQPALAALEDVVEGRRPTRPGDPATAAAWPRPPRAKPLTPREEEVLDMIALGWTARHVAHQLRISPSTVRKHLENIYAKLGTHDRLSAVLAVRSARSGQ